mmetsp:Transcript_21651/g.31915  ORF Transcript_21651/g.31915 Transcript_21651/m.31915 type:complete len:80 (+) Transcript_21651:165-404(+)
MKRTRLECIMECIIYQRGAIQKEFFPVHERLYPFHLFSCTPQNDLFPEPHTHVHFQSIYIYPSFLPLQKQNNQIRPSLS